MLHYCSQNLLVGLKRQILSYFVLYSVKKSIKIYLFKHLFPKFSYLINSRHICAFRNYVAICFVHRKSQLFRIFVNTFMKSWLKSLPWLLDFLLINWLSTVTYFCQLTFGSFRHFHSFILFFDCTLQHLLSLILFFKSWRTLNDCEKLLLIFIFLLLKSQVVWWSSLIPVGAIWTIYREILRRVACRYSLFVSENIWRFWISLCAFFHDSIWVFHLVLINHIKVDFRNNLTII